MKLKKNLLFIFFILAGIIVGGLIADLCSKVPFLQWLAYGETVGVGIDQPFIVDFSVLKIAFGLELGVNVAQVICIILSIFGYKAVSKKL